MSLKKRIILNAGSNWAATFVTLVVGLVLVPLILKNVGTDGYGVWRLLASGLSYVLMLDSAFALAINRFVAYYRNDRVEMNHFVSASFVILLGLGCLTVVGAVLISFFVADIFRAIPAALAGEAQVVCILVGVTLACRMMESNFSGALRGYQYYVRSNSVTAGFQVMRAVLTAVMLLFWKSIVAVQAAFALSSAISALAMFITAKRSIDGFTISLRLVNRAAMKQLWSYTSHSVVRSGSTVAMFNTLMLIVGWKGTAQQVTIYDLGFRIPSLLRSLLGTTQNVFLPAVTTLAAEGKDQNVRSIVKRGARVSAVLTFASSLLLFVFAGEILRFWLRTDVSTETILVMRTLLISVVACGVFEIWVPVLVGLGYLRALTISAVLRALLAVLLMLVLIRGATSVPMAPAVALLVVFWLRSGIWLPWYGTRTLGVGLYEYLRTSVLNPLGAVGISVIGLFALNRLMPEADTNWLLRFVSLALIVGVAFLAVSLRREVTEMSRYVRGKLNVGVGPR